MILQETITVLLNPKNIQHYKKLGYFIPQYKNKNNILGIKQGTTIKVKVSDLPKNCQKKVLCSCENPECTSKPTLVIYQCITRANGKHYCHKCGNNTNEHKEKIIKSNTGRKRSIEYIKSRTGQNSPCWNKNLTNEERKYNKNRSVYPGYPTWSKLVKKHNNYTCQCCGSKNFLHSHHKNNWKDFKKQRIDIDNGAVLCQSCHYLFHKIYGRHHTNKEMFDEFLLLYSNKFFLLWLISNTFSRIHHLSGNNMTGNQLKAKLPRLNIVYKKFIKRNSTH